jgi:hypothetical protein
MLQVRDIVFPAGILDDLADSRIMHVGDIWEKVVLHLEVQSTH